MGKYCVMEMWVGFCVHKPNQELLRRYVNYGYGGCQELQMLLILTSLYRLFNQTHSETFNLSLNVIAKKQSLMLAKPWKKFWINDQIDIPLQKKNHHHPFWQLMVWKSLRAVFVSTTFLLKFWCLTAIH